jgi:hypothetical protein
MKSAYILLLTIFNYSFCFYDAIIPLGHDCQVAHQLKAHHLRLYSLPFDWNHTSYEALTKLLQHNFKNFLAQDSLILAREGHSFILDTQYGMQFIHDFEVNQNFMNKYDEIKVKYDKLVARFKMVLEISEKVLFIRRTIKKEQAIMLDELIHNIYPSLDYTLVVLSDDNAFRQDWGYERIKNFHLARTNQWWGDAGAWRNILSRFDIKLSSLITDKNLNNSEDSDDLAYPPSLLADNDFLIDK